MFGLLHTKKEMSMDSTSSHINYFNSSHKDGSHISRQSFLNRYDQLPLSFFQQIFKGIDIGYTNNYTHVKSFQILAVDSTSSCCSKDLAKYGYSLNKNHLTVGALNLGIYNVTTNTPVALEMVKHSNERKAFIDYMKNKHQYKDSIFVFDRGFVGTEYFKKMDSMNINYVCRLKHNLKIIPDNMGNDYSTNIDGTNIRIIKYTINNVNYYLATNLTSNEFTVNTLM